MEDSVLMVFTGTGKGKTTAAVGQAVRYRGAGKHVLFVQFLKDGTSAEVGGLRSLGIDVLVDRPRPLPIDLGDPDVIAEELALLERAVESARDGHYEAVVLDELAYVAGHASKEVGTRIAVALGEFRRTADVIVTGRDAPKWLVESADLVTECVERAHYFRAGIRARRGREF